MDLELARWLISSPEVIDEAVRELSHADPLAAGSRLRARHPDLTPTQAAAALEQAHLQARASRRYGISASRRLMTRDGLEQASRPEVARHRAAVIAASGARRVVDLTAGLGFDSAAFLAAGLAVTAVERDPVIAALLAHNVPEATVLVGDATELLPEVLATVVSTDVIFIDPARRDPAGPRDGRTGRARPERDPQRWSPSWNFIASIAHPRVAIKTAPAFSPPPEWSAEWISVERTAVECAAYSWPVFASRRALVLDDTGEHPFNAGDISLADQIGSYLHEPDPAIVRAGASLGLKALDETHSWLTSDEPRQTPGLRSFRVIAQLTGSQRQQRQLLRDLGVDGLTVKGKGSNPTAMLRSLAQHEGGRHVLIVLPTGTWLTERERSPQGWPA